MDRVTVYPGSIPLETDLLNTNKNTMIGLSKLMAAAFGTATVVNGLACAPTSVASLNVQVAAGEIYSLQNIDGTAYSSLAADTTHQIVKQGIALDPVTLACPAPVTAGFSVNYLIQASYQDVDSNGVVLPYYNASNPTQAYSGPNNTGASQYTTRKGACTVTAKVGIAATTGSQITPAADAGYVGLWVVTVANAQATITAPNITAYAGAPFLNSSLLGATPAFTVVPTSPTPQQFDATTKVATMAALARMGMQASGFTGFTVNSTLTSAVVGGTVQTANNVSAITLTLPLTSAVLPALGRIEFINTSAYSVTIVKQGSDGLFHINGSLASSGIVLGQGDTLTVECQAANIWIAVSGTTEIGLTAAFAKSTAASGYQKLPSGLIIQWGSTSTAVAANTSTGVSWTFPIAFPTACLFATASAGNFVTSSRTSESSTTTTALGFVQHTSAQTLITLWFAVGY